MMKDLKLWQKMGLVAAIVGGLTLGGLTPKYSSKGLESKLPTVGMSVAEAKETKAEGYEVPDLTGYNEIHQELKDADNDGSKESLMEIFKKSDNDYIVKFSTSKGTWAWIKTTGNDNPNNYAILDVDGKKDSKGNQIFEEKYSQTEQFYTPDWAK